MGEPPPEIPDGARQSLSHSRVLLNYWDPEYEVGYQVIDDQEFVFSNSGGLDGDARACDRSEYELRAINLMNQIGVREPCSDSSSEDDDEPDFQQALA